MKLPLVPEAQHIALHMRKKTNLLAVGMGPDIYLTRERAPRELSISFFNFYDH